MIELPEQATLLTSVWKMREPYTGEIHKYNAIMNVDESRMIKGLRYEET
jgi:hypothetical protein